MLTQRVCLYIYSRYSCIFMGYVCLLLRTSGGMCPLCICPVVICCWAEGIVPTLKVSGPPMDPDRIIPGSATEPCSTRPTRLNCCCKIVDLIQEKKNCMMNFIFNHTLITKLFHCICTYTFNEHMRRMHEDAFKPMTFWLCENVNLNESLCVVGISVI